MIKSETSRDDTSQLQNHIRKSEQVSPETDISFSLKGVSF